MKSTKSNVMSNITAKKMMRVGNRIRREVSKQTGIFSNLTAKRFASWWMQ